MLRVSSAFPSPTACLSTVTQPSYCEVVVDDVVPVDVVVKVIVLVVSGLFG